MWILDAFTARAAYKSVFTRNHTQLLNAMVRDGLKENTFHVLYRILNGFLTICFSVSHLDRGDSAAGSVSTNRPVPPFTIVGMCLSENTSSAGSVNITGQFHISLYGPFEWCDSTSEATHLWKSQAP